jgi:hypothetical protein
MERTKNTTLWLLLCIALVAGCADMKASMREKECASDWFKAGYREGEIGAPLQTGLERHAAHCPNFDAAKYKEGYQKGSATRARPPV